MQFRLFDFRMATVLLFLPSVFCQSAWADISLSKLFSDHMVLQQNRSMPIWGTTEPNETLTIKFDGQSVTATSDKQGRWSATVNTGSAGGPFQLEIVSDDEKTKVVFTDVLVGEVWLCGGQSNMQSPVAESKNAEAEIELAKDFPNIRLFNVEHHASNKPMKDFAKVNPWFCCTPDSIKGFSATGYFFGRQLSNKLDVPIGLINVSRKGTTLEAWTPYDALESDGGFTELLKYWEETNEPNNPNRVSNSYNAMVAPLARFPFRGVIWHQGEANVGRGEQFSRLFPLMINSWRTKLNRKDFPFYFVQLSPFRYQDHAVEALPEIWDAQLKTHKIVSSTGMIVTLDLGDPKDIHPKNKFNVARRLASWSFANCYASNLVKIRSATDKSDSTISVDEQKKAESNTAPLVFSGPIYEKAEIDGDRIIISFRFAESGLKVNEQHANCFTICGSDKKFVPAQIEIVGEKLIVSSGDISSPISVRYAWQDTAMPVLANSNGFPASPFRTDDFPLLSDGVAF